jgi:hypothetical protein
MIFIAKPKGCAIAEKDASENRIWKSEFTASSRAVALKAFAFSDRRI